MTRFRKWLIHKLGGYVDEDVSVMIRQSTPTINVVKTEHPTFDIAKCTYVPSKFLYYSVTSEEEKYNLLRDTFAYDIGSEVLHHAKVTMMPVTNEQIAVRVECTIMDKNFNLY